MENTKNKRRIYYITEKNLYKIIYYFYYFLFIIFVALYRLKIDYEYLQFNEVKAIEKLI